MSRKGGGSGSVPGGGGDSVTAALSAGDAGWPRLERDFLLALLAITALAAALRLYGIADQPAIADEIAAAFSGLSYVESGRFGPTMWYHPNLRNIVLYLTGEWLGYGPYALRGMSLLTGILSVPLLGLICRLLTRDRRASLLAALFLALEEVHITFSRQAIQETWTMFFFLSGLLLVLLFLERERGWLLVLAGVAFGLGVSSKFHALPPLFVCCCACWYAAWRQRSWSLAGLVLSSLVLLPFMVFLLSYLPWFHGGYELTEWPAMQRALLVKMTTHTGNPMDQVIDTRAWQWFLRPMGYANFVFFQGKPYLTVAFSNPVVWLLVLPAAAGVARKALRREGSGARWLLVLFLACYLPLAASPRPIWLLTSLAALPFALMLVAAWLSSWARGARWRAGVLTGYLVLVLVSSLLLYPLATGKGKSYRYLAPIAERFRPPFDLNR